MGALLTAVVSLSVTGALSAIILYIASKKFEVKENPLIGEVQDVLPAANCGGCGFPGCSGFAAACVTAGSLDGLNCPVGGQAIMEKVAQILGVAAGKTDPAIAVVCCNGSCDNRARTNCYDGAPSCAIASTLYGGDTGCSYGCLGLGDCVNACLFDAIYINPLTRLPEVDEEKCTACGACVKACPKMLVELRKKGPKSRRIYVACKNKEKGAVARKSCTVACIGCSKCEKACASDAVTIENNLAFINDKKCVLCRKCVNECPTSSIIALNFPVKKNVLSGQDAPAPSLQ
jgi:Na+-translocating ferredoxin:NAD+ oxidoreductase RNF subunit RnfB